jgi:phosphatidylserine/phosphatidylglycerophosphate/cardiolipin synthase-like enzyme
MKKYIFITAFMFFALLSALQPVYAADLSLLKDTPVKVFFSPKGGCTEAIISEIDRAKTEIVVQAYAFTSAPIAKTLVDAHKRGVKVQAVLDKSQRSEKYTSATFLTNAGIPTYIDGSHAIAHNKIIIIGKTKIITGSFNFTKAAEEKNAESLLIIHQRNWQSSIWTTGRSIKGILRLMEGDQDSGDDPQEIALVALSIRKKLDSSNPADVQNAMAEYLALVDCFYQGYEHLMAPQQYRVAKQDFEYFMRLLDLAIHYSPMGSQSDKGTM